jgi:putative transposase
VKKEIRLRYKVIHRLKNQFPIVLLCELAGVSRSGYYKWFKRQGVESPKEKEDRELKDLIKCCYEEVKGIYGYKRIKIALYRNYQRVVNQKRVYRLMREMGIQAVIRKKNRFFGKKSDNQVATNVLNRD